MKTKTSENTLSEEILRTITQEVEKELEKEIDQLTSSLDNMALADMEKQVLVIRNSIGQKLIQKVLEAKNLEVKKKSKLSSKKNQQSNQQEQKRKQSLPY